MSIRKQHKKKKKKKKKINKTTKPTEEKKEKKREKKRKEEKRREKKRKKEEKKDTTKTNSIRQSLRQMATSLSSQLSNLRDSAAAVGLTRERVSQKARYVSLIYSLREAADISLDTLYENALAALKELQQVHGLEMSATAPFLFTEASKNTQRHMEDAIFNEKLNATLGDFIRVLCPYLLNSHAQSILEYFVRHFRVHEYNVDDLMECCLPFHATPIFAKIASILVLPSRSMWTFLTAKHRHSRRGRTKATKISREALARRCLRDGNLLSFIFDMSRRSPTTSVVLKFTLSITAEVIQLAERADSEDLVRRMLPFVTEALSAGAGQDMRALGYLLASLLGASRFSLSVDAVTALVEDCAASSEEATAERALACMVALVQHVPRDALSGLMSARAASHILSNRQGNLAHNLQSLQSRHGEADVEPFVTAVLSKAVQTAASDPEASSKQLLNLVESGVQGVAGHVTKLLGSLSLEYLKLSEDSSMRCIAQDTS